MEWIEPLPDRPGIKFYNRTILTTPIGQIMIEWENWEEKSDYYIEINGNYVGTSYSLDEAKQKSLNYLCDKYKELKEFLKVP
jgi:hypothetical protein